MRDSDDGGRKLMSASLATSCRGRSKNKNKLAPFDVGGITRHIYEWGFPEEADMGRWRFTFSCSRPTPSMHRRIKIPYVC